MHKNKLFNKNINNILLHDSKKSSRQIKTNFLNEWNYSKSKQFDPSFCALTLKRVILYKNSNITYPNACGRTRRPERPIASEGCSISNLLLNPSSLPGWTTEGWEESMVFKCWEEFGSSRKSSPIMRSMGSTRAGKSTWKAGRQRRITLKASEWPPAPELIALSLSSLYVKGFLLDVR